MEFLIIILKSAFEESCTQYGRGWYKELTRTVQLVRASIALSKSGLVGLWSGHFSGFFASRWLQVSRINIGDSPFLFKSITLLRGWFPEFGALWSDRSMFPCQACLNWRIILQSQLAQLIYDLASMFFKLLALISVLSPEAPVSPLTRLWASDLPVSGFDKGDYLSLFHFCY